MDPIIRSAPVSDVVRRIGRRPHAVTPAAPVAAVPAAAPAVEPAPAPARPAAPAVNAAAPVTPAAPAAPAAPVRDYAAEMALAATTHKLAIEQREGELAQLRAAAAKSASELKDAYVEAERRGYAAGEEQGRQDAMKALQTQVERVRTLVSQIGQSRRELLETSEDALVGIAHEALCRIIGAEGARRETIVDVVRAAIAATGEREQLVVRLHPDDAALFQEGAALIEARFSADPAVKLGGCLVDTASGTLDARFETQLSLLGAALKAARAGRFADLDVA